MLPVQGSANDPALRDVQVFRSHRTDACIWFKCWLMLVYFANKRKNNRLWAVGNRRHHLPVLGEEGGWKVSNIVERLQAEIRKHPDPVNPFGYFYKAVEVELYVLRDAINEIKRLRQSVALLEAGQKGSRVDE